MCLHPIDLSGSWLMGRRRLLGLANEARELLLERLHWERIFLILAAPCLFRFAFSLVSFVGSLGGFTPP